MGISIKTPVLPESISEAKIITWYKKVGESFARDEHLVDFETDKIVLEVVAPSDGILLEILKEPGALVKSEEVVGLFEAATLQNTVTPAKTPVLAEKTAIASPAVRRLASENNIPLERLKGTGKKGRLTKQDVLETALAIQEASPPRPVVHPAMPAQCTSAIARRADRRVPMSRLRARIAERLLDVQRNAAILTTFNEINMQPIMDLREKYKAIFLENHGVRLGFMSFFIQATVEALKRFPIMNASVEGQTIVYHDYYDISVAVSSERGLVVPVIRDADQLHMAQIERKIAEFSEKAKSNQLSLEEMQGGTFTLSNGGVFGSLMSTPLLNPPQSAILGMHKIMPRPVVEEGAMVIRPMMYVALSYDHRIIDGADSVKFLVTLKTLLEEPARVWLEL